METMYIEDAFFMAPVDLDTAYHLEPYKLQFATHKQNQNSPDGSIVDAFHIPAWRYSLWAEHTSDREAHKLDSQHLHCNIEAPVHRNLIHKE